MDPQRTPAPAPTRRRHRSTLTAALTAAALAAVGMATAPTAQAADLNVAKNAGFESGLANWTCTAGASVSTPVRTGAAALKATPAGQDNARCSQSVAVKPGATYTLSAWTQGGYAYLGASGTGTTDVSTWSPGSTAWKQLTTTFRAGAEHHVSHGLHPRAGARPGRLTSSTTSLPSSVPTGRPRVPTPSPASHGTTQA
ncbi:carbohydrate binding domain-containing protein [Streptomyces cremeus]|uniref:carbohydrate binding domain-containing protein n=1 Tax=Streptomyces cremeus TaxID=66881 RepID=UPI0033855691